MFRRRGRNLVALLDGTNDAGHPNRSVDSRIQQNYNTFNVSLCGAILPLAHASTRPEPLSRRSTELLAVAKPSANPWTDVSPPADAVMSLATQTPPAEEVTLADAPTIEVEVTADATPEESAVIGVDSKSEPTVIVTVTVDPVPVAEEPVEKSSPDTTATSQAEPAPTPSPSPPTATITITEQLPSITLTSEVADGLQIDTIPAVVQVSLPQLAASAAQPPASDLSDKQDESKDHPAHHDFKRTDSFLTIINENLRKQFHELRDFIMKLIKEAPKNINSPAAGEVEVSAVTPSATATGKFGFAKIKIKVNLGIKVKVNFRMSSTLQKLVPGLRTQRGEKAEAPAQ
ncbi:hypothetical protein NM688_g9053 [Phlebia brevispora]|uniref:Uncharacterized protein n=1 Tax=Phlebia brevispora TaxID=194682 RepID=A0ACC1RL46_9APHY|nr:hypothetical protein NM688_g9053 [Phlebia brevispora]